MQEVTQYHRVAMALADEAEAARLHGDAGRAADLLRTAFEKEAWAAHLVAPHLDMEPTRSVLHRSAASLALDCGEAREAERLIGGALSGNPPEEIAEELRDLLEQVHFARHLALRGVELLPGEVQISLSAGRSVGFGIVQSEVFVERLDVAQRMLYRTAERKLNTPYRDRGRRCKDMATEFEVYNSVPRAASFAVTLRIGKGRQMKLPGIDFASQVIDDILECLRLFDRDQAEPLKERIPDQAYYRNFVGLARKFAPDGERVRAIGLTTQRPDGEHRVLLSNPQARIRELEVAGQEGQTTERVEVRGTLRLADSRHERRGRIDIVDDQGAAHRIIVPPGMMSDIVRPLYEEEVIVRGRRSGKNVGLESIEPVNP